MLTALFFVGFAALGAVARWTATETWGPIGTTTVNVIGAGLLAIVWTWDEPVFTVVATAGLGALTTVSGWVHQLQTMWRSLERGRASAHGAATVVGGVLLSWLVLSL